MGESDRNRAGGARTRKPKAPTTAATKAKVAARRKTIQLAARRQTTQNIKPILRQLIGNAQPTKIFTEQKVNAALGQAIVAMAAARVLAPVSQKSSSSKKVPQAKETPLHKEMRIAFEEAFTGMSDEEIARALSSTLTGKPRKRSVKATKRRGWLSLGQLNLTEFRTLWKNRWEEIEAAAFRRERSEDRMRVWRTIFPRSPGHITKDNRRDFEVEMIRILPGVSS
jgi:hypothetical protein